MPTGGKGTGVDKFGVSGEGAEVLPGGGGPQFHRAFPRAAQNGGAIGGKRAGHDRGVMSSERVQQLEGRRVVEHQIGLTSD
jgi:hypothetical protein